MMNGKAHGKLLFYFGLFYRISVIWLIFLFAANRKTQQIYAA